MIATSMMTVRIEPDLLAALKKRAKEAGRSVSAEVLSLIRRELSSIPPVKPMPTRGRFTEYEAPDFDDLRRLRRSFSKRARR
ncbi:MAG: hypothetical protein A2138_23835 [Deltaproteobacteria bacterium RBG_16_71_12]|nr:MAG: hypothetical protein A2138_23835 [Deltaproteobacteria bacterium RBG_16_71_12]